VGGFDEHSSCHYLKSPIRVRRTRGSPRAAARNGC
jgi:hypothetical protein